MRISEASTTNKKILALNDIKGVDLTSAPLRVKPTRASYMKNMICKGGVNHKRNGFSQAAEFIGSDGVAQAINGIYPYKSGDSSFIVHAGAHLYFCSADFNKKTLIPKANDVTIANEKSQGYICGGVFYLVCGGRLLVYNGESIKPFYESEHVYIPTTSIAITDTKNYSLSESFEYVNLFGKKRKNKLIGARDGTTRTVSVDADEVDIFTLAGSRGVFNLDGEIDLEKEVTITASVHITGKNNPDKTNVMYLEACFGDGLKRTDIDVNTVFNIGAGTSSANGMSSFIRNGETVYINEFKETAGAGSDIVTFEGTFKATIENRDGHGVVTFEPALPTYVEGEDNITVEYSVSKEEPKIKSSALCDVGAKNKILALALENDVVYFSSASEGFSYVPDMQYVKVLENINGIAPGPDFLAVFSEREVATIALELSSYDEKIVVNPTLLQHHEDVGCLAPYSLSTLSGDLLLLTQGGVYGVEKTGVHARSNNINKELLSKDKELLKKAVSVVNDGRYYLFVGDVVYIADARYKTYESNRLDVSYEYEWWRWEKLPSRCVISYDEKIIIGLDDGAVIVESTEYKDRRYHILSYSEGLTNGESFYFNEELNIKDGDKVKVENAKKCAVHLGDVYLFNNGNSLKITFDIETWQALMLKGLEWPLDSVVITSDNGLKMAYSVTLSNPEELTWFGNYEIISGELTNKDLTVYCGTNDVFTAKRLEDDSYILLDGDGEAISFIDYEDIKIKQIKENPVECAIYTAVIDLGNAIQKKKMHKIVFVPGTTTGGSIEIGYETDKKEVKKSQAVTGVLDFGAIDFNSFTFDASFYKRFEKKVNERNVDFIRFKLSSNSEHDFSIEDFKCIYSINTR